MCIQYGLDLAHVAISTSQAAPSAALAQAQQNTNNWDPRHRNIQSHCALLAPEVPDELVYKGASYATIDGDFFLGAAEGVARHPGEDMRKTIGVDPQSWIFAYGSADGHLVVFERRKDGSFDTEDDDKLGVGSASSTATAESSGKQLFSFVDTHTLGSQLIVTVRPEILKVEPRCVNLNLHVVMVKPDVMPRCSTSGWEGRSTMLLHTFLQDHVAKAVGAIKQLLGEAANSEGAADSAGDGRIVRKTVRAAFSLHNIVGDNSRRLLAEPFHIDRPMKLRMELVLDPPIIPLVFELEDHERRVFQPSIRVRGKRLLIAHENLPGPATYFLVIGRLDDDETGLRLAESVEKVIESDIMMRGDSGGTSGGTFLCAAISFNLVAEVARQKMGTYGSPHGARSTSPVVRSSAWRQELISFPELFPLPELHGLRLHSLNLGKTAVSLAVRVRPQGSDLLVKKTVGKELRIVAEPLNLKYQKLFIISPSGDKLPLVPTFHTTLPYGDVVLRFVFECDSSSNSNLPCGLEPFHLTLALADASSVGAPIISSAGAHCIDATPLMSQQTTNGPMQLTPFLVTDADSIRIRAPPFASSEIASGVDDERKLSRLSSSYTCLYRSGTPVAGGPRGAMSAAASSSSLTQKNIDAAGSAAGTPPGGVSGGNSGPGIMSSTTSTPNILNFKLELDQPSMVLINFFSTDLVRSAGKFGLVTNEGIWTGEQRGSHSEFRIELPGPAVYTLRMNFAKEWSSNIPLGKLRVLLKPVHGPGGDGGFLPATDAAGQAQILGGFGKLQRAKEMLTTGVADAAVALLRPRSRCSARGANLLPMDFFSPQGGSTIFHGPIVAENFPQGVLFQGEVLLSDVHDGRKKFFVEFPELNWKQLGGVVEGQVVDVIFGRKFCQGWSSGRGGRSHHVVSVLTSTMVDEISIIVDVGTETTCWERNSSSRTDFWGTTLAR